LKGAILGLLFLLACPGLGAEEAVLKKASFIPHWSPQAQFAGYYVALDKGIYRKYGIDAGILQGGPDFSSCEYLKDKKADFASIWLSRAIQMRSEGVRLINVAQVMQRSALILIAKKSGGIHEPKDLNGKKVSLWEGDFQLQPKAFFKKYGLDVKIVPQSYTINLFLRDGVDAVSAMWYNEYHTIINSGIDPDELTTFFFDEYGLNFPEDGIYTLEETFRRDPSLVYAFVQASLEGWLYSFSHPDEAVDVVLKYMRDARIPVNKVHQKWMLERMRDLILPKDTSVMIGVLDRSDYEVVAGVLRENGMIKDVPDFDSFFIRCADHAKR
jgi:NitT/TauT family transport system substrate-binding protein